MSRRLFRTAAGTLLLIASFQIAFLIFHREFAKLSKAGRRLRQTKCLTDDMNRTVCRFKSHMNDYVTEIKAMSYQTVPRAWTVGPSSYAENESVHSRIQITVVTQLSKDRLARLGWQANKWPGPISAALYVDTDDQARHSGTEVSFLIHV